jgi:hypothetical protein
MELGEHMDRRDLIEISSALVLGIVLGILGAWLVMSPDSGTSGSDQARLSGERPLVADSSPRAREREQMQRCSDAAGSMVPALGYAASAVEQWEVHVGAMNKLVVGALTLPQATALWNRTRVGARERIRAFDRAWARVQQRGLDCPRPGLLPAQSPHDVRSCARRVTTDLHVLYAAKSAIDTWSRHVHAMEMLRMGKVSAATATQMWLTMWQRGQQEVTAYRAAARAAHHGSRCAAGSGASPVISP